MTVEAPSRPAVRTPARAEGGLPARRAMLRWAARMLRREWRSQILLALLLLVAVAVAVGGGCVLYNAQPPADPTMGTATDVRILAGHDRRAMAADLAALRHNYGTIDVVGHTPERAPGLARPIDYRAQSLHGTFTGHLLDIRHGRYPSGPREAAVTTGVAELLGLRLGGTIGLDGHARTIVGIAENPSDLTDDFVLVTPGAGPAVRTSSVFGGNRGPGQDDLRLTTQTQQLGQGANNDRVVITTLVLAGATILLLLVAFVAAAGFAVLAHRRLRQLGMLAAIGATARQVRLVLTATGLLIGVAATTAGTLVGLLAWLPAASWLEPALGHRIDRLNVPWILITAVAVLAVVMAAGAAWWPARAISRLPVTLALSGRPPSPRSVHRPAALAALFLAVGLASLAIGEKKHPPLVVLGTVALALAILFASPLAVSRLGTAGGRAPVAVRLALRDLARHQARSGAAVAAISLALGVPVAIVIVATGTQGTATTGNLGDRQVMIRTTPPSQPAALVPIRTETQLRQENIDIERMAAVLGHPVVLPLDMAYRPDAPAETDLQGSRPVRHAVELGVARSGSEFATVPAYVATPPLLRFLGVDMAAIPSSSDVITSRVGDPVAFDPRQREQQRWPLARFRGPRYTSLPDTLLTSGAITRRGLTTIRAGWLLESARPVTGAQLAAVRDIAAQAGLNVESRNSQQAARTVRASATGAGVVLALAVLAMTVGLIRSEGAADLRTLTATGATAGIRRTLTATTAGALALLGTLLGTVGGGLGLAAVYRHDFDVFGRVPLVYPLIFLLGVPLAATIAGWLLAGREPPAIARRLSD